MNWTPALTSEDMILTLHQQGEMQTFDPASYYHLTKTAPAKPAKQSAKARQIIADNKARLLQCELDREQERLAALKAALESRTGKEPVPLNEMATYVCGFKHETSRYEAILTYLEYHVRRFSENLPPSVPLLYLEAIDLFEKHPKHRGARSILRETQRVLDEADFDLVAFQLVTCPEYLPPQSPFRVSESRLEPWQLDVMKRIDQRKSLLIVAPTSSGKTACMNYIPSTVPGKALYVVPSNELAKQVAGMYRRSLKGGVALITNRERFIEENWRVLVGTPYTLENYLTEHEITFTYAVYDEVQKLNPDRQDYLREGAAYERIMRLVSCPIVALTATIEDPVKFQHWLSQTSGQTVELIVHTRRPIIQQLCTYDGKLTHVCGLDVLTAEEFTSEALLALPMTPRDLYRTYQRFASQLPEELDPDECLCKRLTLDDVEGYRVKLLTALQGLARAGTLKLPSEVPDAGSVPDTPETYYQLGKKLQQKNMLPALCFRRDEAQAYQTYENLVVYLETEEARKYPYYKDDLHWLRNCQQAGEEKLKELENRKVPEGTADARAWLESQRVQLKTRILNQVKSEFAARMSAHIAADPANATYYRQFQREIQELDSLDSINPYAPHPDFTFREFAMGEPRAREVRRALMARLRGEEGFGVDFARFSFDHIFLRGILRGVVLYTRTLPAPFQHVAQSLVAGPDAPLVISDDSLASGVNFPIRTVVLAGGDQELDVVKSHQMMGRSGRRGIDREGYVVFMNFDWSRLMRSPYAPLVGEVSLGWYSLYPTTFTTRTLDLTPKTLRETMLGVDETPLRIQAQEAILGVDYTEAKAMWHLRWCEALGEVGLTKLERYLRFESLNDTFTYLLELLRYPEAEALREVFIQNRIDPKLSVEQTARLVRGLRQAGDFLRGLYPFSPNRKQIEMLFQRIRMIWSKHQL